MNKFNFDDNFFDSSVNSIIFLNSKKEVIKANPSFYKISGYIPKDLIGKNINIINSDRIDNSSDLELWNEVEEKGFWEGSVWLRKRNGSLFLSKRTILLNKNKNSVSYIILSEETEEDGVGIELDDNLLTTDFITGLPQSFIFREFVTNLIKESRSKNEKFAIVLIDLVRFKQINESFGYSAGDNFLNIASERIQQSLDVDCFMSRVGGDIFSICIKEVEDHSKVTNIVEKIISSFKTIPFIFKGQEIYLSVTAGISMYPNDGSNFKELLKSSDLARYRSKETGGNHYHFYLPSLNARVFEKLVLETNLRKAIEEDKLILHYQPKVDIISNEVIGMEALIRWQHPEFGTVSPAQFIPTAEETGLIIPIGRWVIKQACFQMNEWNKKGYNPIKVSVNISPAQLIPSLVDDVIYNLNTYNIDPNYLELEITETAIMKNVEESISILKELESIGVSISIDDFGTGYSSLNYLAKLPLHALKIDRSFIQDVSISKEAATIVSTIIAMAHKLNLSVVAEGVEKESDLKFLRKLKCEHYQGFYFSQPILPEKIEEYLKKTND